MKSGATRVRASRLLLIVGLAAHWSRYDAFVGRSPAPVLSRCSAGRRSTLRALPGSRTLRHEVGDIVEVRCEDDGLWYQAIVEHENSDGTFTVRFDKDGYEYHYPLVAWRVPKTRHFIEELEEGEVLNGRVTDISSTGFYVDVGAEDEGFVHISEIKEGRVVRIEDEVRIGQDVSLRVLSTQGKLSLSMKPPATGPSDSMGLAAFRDLPPDALLRATITDTPAFGAFAMVQPPAGGEPCRGLIHISEMGGGGFVPSVEEHVSVGEEVLVSVISTEGGRLSLRLKNEESGFEIEKGIWLSGSVVKTMSYGAFVKVHCQGEERVGLLHVSEMADDFIENCTEAVSVGENITVQLLQSNKGRISWTARSDRVSAEELEPFVGLRRKDFLTGLVQETREGGAYVLLQPPDGGIAVQGVLRRQEMNLKDGESVEDVLKVGEEVEVLVKFAENGRLLLSMGPLVPSAFQEIPEDLWLRGVVKDLMEFGVFVAVQAPTGEEYTGLVHISQYKERFVKQALMARELKVGQEVSVRVIEVDGNRLSLSMRPPSSAKDGKERSRSAQLGTALPALPLQGMEGEWLDATVQETLPLGAVLSVTDPASNETLLGKIHIIEMSERYLDSVDEAVSVNDSVKVRLLNRDELSFSMRKVPKPLTLEGNEVEGQVTNVSNSGAVVKMKQQGNMSELWGYLPWSEVEKLRPAQGAEVRCRILSLQGEKLALTMRTSDCSLKDFACKDVLNAVVQEVTALGIFVRLQPLGGGRACRGLVHVSFLKASDDFAEGDLVKVQVQNASTSLQLSLAE